MCGQCRDLASRTHRTKRFLCATCVISSGMGSPGQCNVKDGVELSECIVLVLVRNKMHVPPLESAVVLDGSKVPCVTQRLVHHTFMQLVCATPTWIFISIFFCMEAAICSNSLWWPKNSKQQQK